MDSFSLHPTYVGSVLREAINTVHPERKALIENFLYEKSALLIYADDGVGKSVLTLQACLQATCENSKVFGEFNVPQSSNVLYFQMERHPDESFERMRHLQHVIPFDDNKFALSVALQGIDLQDQRSKGEALATVASVIKETNFVPHIIAFDPIYTMARDGLENAVACNSITSFFRIIQLAYNSTILATSHTNRGIRGEGEDKGKRVGKDMYGNRFLSAFFTGSYHLEGKPDGAGSIWKLDKNSQRNLEKKFELMYDASNYQSIFLSEGKFSKKDKLENFLKACKNQDKEFSFEEMIANSDLSDSMLRRYLCSYLKDLVKESSKLSRGKLLYKYFG